MNVTLCLYLGLKHDTSHLKQHTTHEETFSVINPIIIIMQLHLYKTVL